MTVILPRLRLSVKDRLLRNLRRCHDARLRAHYFIVITLNEGIAVAVVAQTQQVHRDTVYRIARRFRERGEIASRGGYHAVEQRPPELALLDARHPSPRR